MVRADAALRDRVQTVMIMRRDVAVLIAPKIGKIQKIGDLAGAMVGVTREGPLDGGLLLPVLDYYGVGRDKTKYMALPTRRDRERAQDQKGRRHHRGRRDRLQAMGDVLRRPRAA